MLTQVVGVNVANPHNPLSHLAALRNYGLPVDTLLPPTADKNKSPLLLEDEVLEFLSQGLAAPLPNAYSVMPF